MKSKNIQKYTLVGFRFKRGIRAQDNTTHGMELTQSEENNNSDY